MLILISDPFDTSLPDKLSNLGTVTSDKNRIAEAHVVLVRSKTICGREFLDQASQLKLIIRGGVGIDNIDVEYAKQKGIIVRNTPKASAVSVAELTFSMMLSIPNHIVTAHSGMKNGQWLKNKIKRSELFGKTLCLVGIGNIATEVAKRAAAFGMNVIAYDKYVKKSKWAEIKPSLEEAVQDADYISLHLPLTDETEYLMNSKIIESCKKNPIVINTGRGNTVNAHDMKKALEQGKVRWYATDVWPTDPPAPNYPILSAPHTLMTPHIGAGSQENLMRIGQEAYNIIENVFYGGSK